MLEEQQQNTDRGVDSVFTDPVEAALSQALEDFDPEALVVKAENAMSSAEAREALVKSMKDKPLDFVRQVQNGVDKAEVRVKLAENLHKMKFVAEAMLEEQQQNTDRGVVSAFTDPVEAALSQALEDFDPEALVAQAENAMSSAEAREALVNSMKDKLLDFVRQVQNEVDKAEVRVKLAANLHKMKQVAKAMLEEQQQNTDRGVVSAFTDPVEAALLQALEDFDPEALVAK